MELKHIHSIYFLGIGGIGMSALARYFHLQGTMVNGYDKTKTSITDALEAEGINVHFEENIELIPSNVDLVVYTPAVPKDHTEYLYLIEKNIPIIKRSDLLGMITNNVFTIAVSGTHGKTSITSMIAFIINTAGKNVNAFIGGISKNFNSNLLVNSQAPDIIVVEADEFDRSFLKLYPDIAVISSMDADHLDIYENKENVKSSFFEFTQHIKTDGKLVLKSNLSFEKPTGRNQFIYSLNDSTDFYASEVRIENYKHVFSINNKQGKIENIHFGIPGRHNVENAVAAAAVASLIGIEAEEIKKGLENYQGVQRRFDYRVKQNNILYIDDYAHHPEELKSCINSVRELYPNKKITGIFQPHLFTRTRDFADEFACSLDLLDEVILLEIYPAREKPIEGVDSKMLLNKIKIKEKIVCSEANLLFELKNREIEVLLTLGAGNIDQLVEPIENLLNTRI